MLGIDKASGLRFVRFVKMQGLGNDFVLIDARPEGALDGAGLKTITPELASWLCDRRRGVGADQILLVRPPSSGSAALVGMDVFNPDGSFAEICGNGLRAVGIYLNGKRGENAADGFLIETGAGLKQVWVKGDQVRVEMGMPELLGGFVNGQGEKLSLELDGVRAPELRFYEVSMGNPHAVFFVEKLVGLAETLGPQIESASRFPRRTNVEFAQVLGRHSIRVEVWERGAGRTLACGTGACAVAVAAIATGRAESPVAIDLPGGTLRIEWKPDSAVMMEGPACESFRGEVDLQGSF